MNSFRAALIIAAFLLTAPAAAHAGSGPLPWNKALCNTAGTCVTPYEDYASGARPLWTGAWGTMVPWGLSHDVPGGTEYLATFKLYHPNRRDAPWRNVGILIRYTDANVLEMPYPATITDTAALNKPDCGRLEGVDTGKQPRILDAGPGVGIDAAVTHACWPTTFDANGKWIPPVQPGCDSDGDANQDGVCDSKPAVARPVAAVTRTCAPIVHARKRVAVTARGQACAPARNVLARYMRRGFKPQGWTCRTMRNGRVRTVSCGTPARARSAAKRIIGRYRV